MVFNFFRWQWFRGGAGQIKQMCSSVGGKSSSFSQYSLQWIVRVGYFNTCASWDYLIGVFFSLLLHLTALYSCSSHLLLKVWCKKKFLQKIREERKYKQFLNSWIIRTLDGLIFAVFVSSSSPQIFILNENQFRKNSLSLLKLQTHTSTQLHPQK